MTDAGTNANDSINLVLDSAAVDVDLDANTIEVNDVETVNIASLDSDPVDTTPADGVEDIIESNQMILAADSATTVTVEGNATTALTLDASSDQVTLIDASTMTGALTVKANGATAGTTVNGGSGADNLTADGNGDVLNGGAGNDTLIGANLSQLTGNEAVNLLGSDTNDAAWFQFGGNTYIVQSGGDHSTGGTPDFQNGQDSIIQITGLVDLSTASYNQTNGTLEIA
jgi:S-layer protein